MDWKPIVVGLDRSEASARAARVGWAIARATNTQCHFVHAAPDRWASVRDLTLAAAATIGGTPLGALGQRPDPPPPRKAEEIAVELGSQLPEGVPGPVAVDTGHPATVLRHAVERLHAGLIVVGGKHHAAVGRWIVGSTVHELVRTLDVPMLVVGDAPATISRILVAVDLAPASRSVLATAQGFAAACETAFLALHVAADLPEGTERLYGLTRDDITEGAERVVQERLWNAITLPRAETAVRWGPIYETVREEARNWDADLVVVGSHGHGWDGRMLLGGTTTKLLDDLPASLLVVPVT